MCICILKLPEGGEGEGEIDEVCIWIRGVSHIADIRGINTSTLTDSCNLFLIIVTNSS